MRWHLDVDANMCIGSGLCAAIAPAHFHLVNGVSTAVHEVVEPADAVLDAEGSCPVEAIAVRNLSPRVGEAIAVRELSPRDGEAIAVRELSPRDGEAIAVRELSPRDAPKRV